MSSKHSKYVVNQTLKDVDDISFRELFGRIKVSSFFSFFFFFYKIRPVLVQGICIYLGQFIDETQSKVTHNSYYSTALFIHDYSLITDSWFT